MAKWQPTKACVLTPHIVSEKDFDFLLEQIARTIYEIISRKNSGCASTAPDLLNHPQRLGGSS